RLHAIREISRILRNSVNLEDVLEKTLDAMFSIFSQADCGFILLKDENTQELRPKPIKARRGEAPNLTISRTILDPVMIEGKAIRSRDAGADSRFKGSNSINAQQIRTILCAPILDQERLPFGIIQIDTRECRANFHQDDLDLLVDVAGQVSLAVENIWLHQ